MMRRHYGGMTSDRPNTILAVTVDQALDIYCELGRHAAAAFLESHGASFALTCRVLAEPERRRVRAIDLPSARTRVS